MKGLCTYSICLYSLANLCVASTCQTDPSEWTRWVRSGEPYSIAACNTSDPEARFQEEKAHLDDRASTALLMPAVLARTAMAALEAGLPGEAQSYAEQALVAATAPRYANARPVSF